MVQYHGRPSSSTPICSMPSTRCASLRHTSKTVTPSAAIVVRVVLEQRANELTQASILGAKMVELV